MEPPEQYSNDLAGKAVFLLFSNTFLFKTNNLQSKKKKMLMRLKIFGFR